MADRQEGPRPQGVRTVEDLDRAVRALSRHFKTDRTFIIGSQAILVGWPDAPLAARMSMEVDAYPANAREWEAAHGDIEASEEINALFGEGSPFAETYGFYIDGVDDRTAVLPSDWRSRAVTREIVDENRRLTAIAPATVDLVVSKLWRLDDKDKAFIRALHQARPLNVDDVWFLFKSTMPEPARLVLVEGFLKTLI